MLFASVALQEAVRSYDKLYDYIIPDQYKELIQVGMRVLIPFGSKDSLRTGYVFDIHTNGSKNTKYKEIHEIVDQEPLLTSEMIKLARWMRTRYFCTYGDAIRVMIPAGINLKLQRFIRLKEKCDKKSIWTFIKDNNFTITTQQEKVLNKIIKKPEGIEKEKLDCDESCIALIKEFIENNILEEIETFNQALNKKTVKAVKPVISKEEFDYIVSQGKLRSIYPIRIMDVLLDEGYCTLQDLLLISGVSHSTVRNLAKKGWIEYFELEVERNPFENIVIEKSESHSLTYEQQNIVDNVLPLLQEKKLNEVLIHGITGSGKTEVYLELIEAAIKLNRPSIVLVPEISLTPQMISRFIGRFGNRIAVQHSRLSQGERYDQWRKIKAGEVDVVIGARSAVFAPFTNIGFIIVDEEHESSYKSESTPKYDARQIARARCNINGAVLVLGSATPSIETYYRAINGKIRLFNLKNRPNELPLPKVDIIDLREELKAGNHNVLSRRLEEELIKNKNNGEQSIIFLNRRGFASFILCRDCGFVIKCPNCSISLTVHTYDKQIICHYCGYSNSIPNKCPDCSSPHIKPFGTGTQKVEKELENHTEGFKTIRMDLDTTLGKKGHQKILDAFRNKEADILIGTQMVAKGHDFPNVTLVGILAADSYLFNSDYRASERTFQLVTQASGRAGRGEIPGRVILQAYNIDDYAIQAGVKQDYEEFYNKEIIMRHRLISPPFCHIGLIVVSSENSNDAKESIDRIRERILTRYSKEKGFLCSNSMQCPVFLIKNRYRWRIIVKMVSINRLVDLMNYVSDEFRHVAVKGTGLSVDIDPAAMI
ncbi:MAG: primosomal protein N' [Clostridiaceae bacterium]|nr:primosomal protein N' [Clostridiaceae bacterium]